jgi:hypothetical protein
MPRRPVSIRQTSLFPAQGTPARGTETPGGGQGAAALAGGTRSLTISDLIGPDGVWLYPDACAGCGRLHDGPCPAPVTEPPSCLFDDACEDEEGGLTPLGKVVQDAAHYLAMRGWLDGEWPDWLLADLAALAREKPCGPVCRATPDGFLNPSDAADHFMTRRREEWERWLPVWACACGMAFKVNREGTGAAFYETGPDGLMGDLVGCVTADARRNIKDSGDCPGCGRLFADTIAGRPVTPRAEQPKAPAEPPPTLF